MEQALLHDVMLAYEMDGKPLAREHGAPVRLVIPEMYGYKNVKWLEPDQSRAAGAARLLGVPRLRPRRLGRPLERLPLVKVGPAFLAHRAHAALGERRRLLPAARDGAHPLSAAAVDPRRPAAADQGHPLLGRRRVDRGARARRAARRPARPAAHGARPRALAAEPPQRRPEDERAPDRRVRAALPRVRACCSTSASATRASAGRAPSSCTTGCCTRRSCCSPGISISR